jgi:hypothetical protein
MATARAKRRGIWPVGYESRSLAALGMTGKMEALGMTGKVEALGMTGPERSG